MSQEPMKVQDTGAGDNVGGDKYTVGDTSESYMAIGEGATEPHLAAAFAAITFTSDIP